MVSIVVVFLVFVLVLYAYRHHNHEFEATASAIRQIWSGSCRLSCRQSEYSSFSGLSGLEKAPAPAAESVPCQNRQSTAGQRDCVCETCPCALIENVLRTCKPATSVYNQSIELISSSYYSIVKALYDAQKYVERVADCRVSCQNQAQLLTIKQVCSADNINFINQTAVLAENKVKDTEPSHSKEVEGPRKEIIFQDESDVAIINEPSKTVAVSQKRSLNDSTKYASDSESSLETVSERKSCSKCIEKGKTCIGSCPRANAVHDLWCRNCHSPVGLVRGPFPSASRTANSENGSPIRCLIKASVIVAMIIFVLCLPLGDPYKYCNGSRTTHGQKLAMCCICEIYLVSTNVACKSMEIFEVIYEWILYLLYELKLKFYGFLGKIDGDDLCRTTCNCLGSTMSRDELERKSEHRPCKCMRKCKYKNAN